MRVLRARRVPLLRERPQPLDGTPRRVPAFPRQVRHALLHPPESTSTRSPTASRTASPRPRTALTQVLFGLDEVGLTGGETVVIQGGGGLGQNAIAVANDRGAETIPVEGVEERIDRARAFGVDHIVDFREHDTVEARAERVRELTDGRGADVGVEVAGVPDAFAEGPHLLRDGARYLDVGNITPGHTTEFDLSDAATALEKADAREMTRPSLVPGR